MAAVPTTVLRDVRLDFFTDNNDTSTTSTDLACGLVASADVLELQGASGTTAVRLTGLADATAAGDAISAGYTSWKAPVRYATTAALAAGIYDNGVFTADNDGPLSIGAGPGVTPTQGDRILVKDQGGADADQNGIYVVTTVGDGSTPFVLTRAHDFATGTTISGAAVVVRAHAGGSGGDKMYIVSSDGPITVGTTDIAFAEIGGSSGPVEIANGSINGDKLASPLYKENLTIGNSGGGTGDTIRFGESSATEADHTVGIWVNNALRLSATAAGGAFVGTWSGSSDEKWKDLLGPISADPLADLDKVDSQTWTWKPGYQFGNAGAFGAGIVAQQFQLVCPSAVTFSAEQDGLVVDYNAVHSFNLACIKALKAENASRQAENAALEARVASLEQDNTDLKARLAALEAAFHAHTHP
jgi:hypothetical protein